jgi:hypothetical protein
VSQPTTGECISFAQKKIQWLEQSFNAQLPVHAASSKWPASGTFSRTKRHFEVKDCKG